MILPLICWLLVDFNPTISKIWSCYLCELKCIALFACKILQVYILATSTKVDSIYLKTTARFSCPSLVRMFVETKFISSKVKAVNPCKTCNTEIWHLLKILKTLDRNDVSTTKFEWDFTFRRFRRNPPAFKHDKPRQFPIHFTSMLFRS